MKNITKIESKVKKINKRLKVCAYCRVSMETERLNHSLSQQISYYNEFIQKNPNWEFAGVFADYGLSGTQTKKRLEFNRMIDEAKKGNIDIILTKSISRFARNTVDLLNTVRMLKDKGIEVRFEKENINTLTGDGELMLSILASFSQEESRSISENVKWGTRKRFEEGIPNGRNKVFGYYWKGNELIVIEKEAKIVRYIYKRYLEGASRIEIGRELMADGIRAPLGGKWADSNVKAILRNITYSGDLLFQKEYVEDPITKHRRLNKGELPQYLVKDHHKAIIDKKTWNKVQEEMKRRRDLGPFGNKSLNTTCFTGKLKCPYCNISYMHSGKIEKSGKRSDYYVCGSRKMGRSKCPSSGTIQTYKLKEICCKVLGMNKFDDNRFLREVDYINVDKNKNLEFHLKNGKIVNVKYERDEYNRKKVWTNERRNKWSEYILRGGNKVLKMGFKEFLERSKNAKTNNKNTSKN